jgi:hypothetical protein
LAAALLAASLAALLAAPPAPVFREVERFAEEALRADPEVRIEDAYKWLFHASRGGEHAIRDAEAARAWLEREWASLGAPEPEEPLVVALRPDGALVRLNLRPYRARGGRPSDILDAFVRSASAFRGDGGGFEAAWGELGRRLEARPFGHLDARAFRALDAEARAKGFPAWHHSPSYQDSKRPAYRVLTGEEARRLAGLLSP